MCELRFLKQIETLKIDHDDIVVLELDAWLSSEKFSRIIESLKSVLESAGHQNKLLILDSGSKITTAQFWLCGHWTGKCVNGVAWELQGVFTSKVLATAVCKDQNYFIAPVDMNVAAPPEMLEMVGVEYPLAEVKQA